MSITIELPARLEKILQDEAERTGKTLGEIANERLAALYEDVPLDTRTRREKVLDEFRAQEKADWQKREDKLLARAREAMALRELE